VCFFCDGILPGVTEDRPWRGGSFFCKKVRLEDAEIGTGRSVRISLGGPEGWGEYPTLLVHIRFSS